MIQTLPREGYLFGICPVLFKIGKNREWCIHITSKRCQLVNKKDVKVNITCGSGLNDAIPPPPDKYANQMSPQSNELTRGPPELAQHFRLQGEFTSAQERCMS